MDYAPSWEKQLSAFFKLKEVSQVSVFNLTKMDTKWTLGDEMGCVLVQETIGELIKASGRQRLPGPTCFLRGVGFVRLHAAALPYSRK